MKTYLDQKIFRNAWCINSLCLAVLYSYLVSRGKKSQLYFCSFVVSDTVKFLGLFNFAESLSSFIKFAKKI